MSRAPAGAADPHSARTSVAPSGLLDSGFLYRGPRDAKIASLAPGYSLAALPGLEPEFCDRNWLIPDPCKACFEDTKSHMIAF